MKRAGLIAILAFLWALTAHRLAEATTVVGYTQPQTEHYSDGTSDIISYPIYRVQEATK